MQTVVDVDRAMRSSISKAKPVLNGDHDLDYESIVEQIVTRLRTVELQSLVRAEVAEQMHEIWKKLDAFRSQPDGVHRQEPLALGQEESCKAPAHASWGTHGESTLSEGSSPSEPAPAQSLSQPDHLLQEKIHKQTDKEAWANHWSKNVVPVPAKRICIFLAMVYCLGLSIGCALVYSQDNHWSPSFEAQGQSMLRMIAFQMRRPVKLIEEQEQLFETDFKVPELALAEATGLLGAMQKTCAINMLVAFSAVIACVSVSTLVVIWKPKETPPDWVMKGTLSCVSQDTATAHGRLFAIGLAVASLLSIMSSYTFLLYRRWIPNVEYVVAWYDIELEGQGEQTLRLFWSILPQVGFMFVALIPSYSSNHGYQSCLSCFHALLAILSMAGIVVMEVIQLSWGEQAFDNFFTSGSWVPALHQQVHHTIEDSFACWNDGVDGGGCQLNHWQRWRVVVVIYAILAILIFLCVQIRFGLRAIFKASPQQKESHLLALVSYFGEITALALVYTLPALAAAEHLWHTLSDTYGSSMDEVLWYSILLNHARGGLELGEDA